MQPKLHLIGAGMGDTTLLTHQSSNIIKKATRVFSTKRIAKKLQSLNPAIKVGDLAVIRQHLRENVADTVVVLSGDAGFYSLSNVLVTDFHHLYDVEIINGLNSLQYLAGKLAIPYNDIPTISMHGRDGGFLGAVSTERQVFVLTGGIYSVTALLQRLQRQGGDRLEVIIGEELSSPKERIVCGLVCELVTQNFAPLAVMLVKNSTPMPLYNRLRDSDFIRGTVPMTKEAVRVLSISHMEISPTDIVFDIGAGTGSVSIAMAQKATRGKVIAIEKEVDGVALIQQNRVHFGAYHINIVHGIAPDILEKLPIPDCVFIGGSGGNMKEIFQVLNAYHKKIRFCITAITLESLVEVSEVLKQYSVDKYDITCLNAAVSHKVGKYNMMKAENPIYVISGRLQGE